MTALQTRAAMALCLAVVVAEGAPAPRRAANELSPSAALGAEPDASNACARRDLSDTSGKLRTLQTEVEGLQNEAEEVDALRKNAKGIATRGPFWRIHREVELAGNAKRVGVERDFLESLIRSAGLNVPHDFALSNTRSSVLTGVWTAAALSILEQNVPGKEKEFLVPSVPQWLGPGPGPPGGVRGVLISWSFNGGGDTYGTALAAIDSYADDRARDFLLVYALDTSEDKYGQPSPLTAWALRFLSCYDPKPIKAKIEAAYQAAIAGRSFDVKSTQYRHKRFGCLGSCVTQLEFSESLEPGPRKRFQRMLRLLECTYALSPQRTAVPPRANPAILFPSWQDGDERFLPHLLATGRISARTLAKAPISPEGWAWLKEQPGWGDWRPAHVKGELPRILREPEGVKEGPERPGRNGPPEH